MFKLNSPSYSSNQLIDPHIPTLIRNNSQFRTKPVAVQSSHYKTLLPLAPQLSLKNNTFNPHLNILMATRMPSQISKPQFALNSPSSHKSHSINKCTANSH